MVYDITERVAEARAYFDSLLDKHIKELSEVSGVPAEQMVKLNPLDFIEKNPYQQIRGYTYQNVGDWIQKTKTDDNFLISPEDAIEETANQIAYKSNEQIEKTLRASKCEVVPVPVRVGMDFFVRNHRQSLPIYREASLLTFGLTYKNELVAVMSYDKSNGGVRGEKKHYELVRLAIRHGYRIHGGASKLQKACEETLRAIGETQVFSYSNATINNGKVYQQLGFTDLGVKSGQPFVLLKNNTFKRLLCLTPHTSIDALAARGNIKCHLGGNKIWVKEI